MQQELALLRQTIDSGKELAALAAGVAPDRIRRSIYAFAPVEHRLEPVRETDGVLWINDSKATNVDSVWYALESMKRPVVWIAGGLAKGGRFEQLVADQAHTIKAAIIIGKDQQPMLDAFKAEMQSVFGEKSCYVLSVRSAGGTKVTVE